MATTNRIYYRKMENYENDTNFTIHNHHLVKGPQVVTSDKLTLTEIYILYLDSKS